LRCPADSNAQHISISKSDGTSARAVVRRKCNVFYYAVPNFGGGTEILTLNGFKQPGAPRQGEADRIMDWFEPL